ncbi:NAD(P)/FAD-dependent oxidoreductase [Peredibacter starrii]|uniref:NAD(P)/FAD-dependent oxidoreductase n=1 Tax=Peredibacter starrii TaxID=28202 RepID=A0AAX4HM22_9BACT|nr:NAD(P)/FAD-dependent oxidoreductase [Peredibacter starrii]WPU64318.1 NAD(P)/FAD-dependent oxidoreductase [Peredibacter starrii]
MKEIFDVVIVGGGPAGLSAALTLGRGNRSVLILDEGKGRNAPASHMMNFPSRDGTPPMEFRELIKRDLRKYSNVQIASLGVKSIVREEHHFLINEEIKARKILLAHGVKDILLPLPGFSELWGKSIFHCPYCHGYEHLKEPIGIIGDNKTALHYAILVKSLTDNLIVFSNGAEVDPAPFEKNGIKVYSSPIDSLIHQGDRLIAVKLMSGETIERSYLFYRPEQKLTSDLGTKLGCELNEHGLYKVQDSGETTVKGIYAAGDITELRQSVLMATASGQKAAAHINFEILHERF